MFDASNPSRAANTANDQRDIIGWGDIPRGRFHVPKVLLVEDSQESREGLSRYLRRKG